MARLPQFQEQFIPTAVSDPSAGAVGQSIAQAGELAFQTGDIFQQRRLANDMTKVSELSTDFELQMQDEFKAFQEARSANPTGFSGDFDSIVKKKKRDFIKSSGLGFQGRQALSRIVENQRANFGTKANNFETQKELENFANSVEKTAENNNLLAFRAGEDLDLDGLNTVQNSVEANVLAGASFVPKDRLENMSTVQIQSAHKNWFDGAIQSDPEQALQMLESGEFDDKLGADNVKSLQDKAAARINLIKAEQEKSTKEFTKISRVAAAMNGEILLDPKTTDDKKAVDSYWEFISEQHDIEGADAQTRINDAKIISEKTGIIPAQVKTTTSAMLFNGDTSQQAFAAEFISDITTDRPRVAEQYDSKTRAFAQSVSTNINAGVDQKKAVEWARNSIDDNLKAERDIRQREYSGGKNSKLVQRDMGKMESSLRPFFGDIDVGEDLIADFANLQENYYLNEGVDRETAFDLAEKDIKNLYGVTKIGPKRYMKYAPEKFYGQQVEENFGVKPDWIQKQVLSDVAKAENRIFADDKEFKEFEKNISLEVNPDSIIGGQDPTYYVFEGNEFGGLDLVTDDNNQPFEYVPDFQRTEEFQKLQQQQKERNVEDIREQLKEARQEKAFKLKQEDERRQFLKTTII
jgi:hypothetical protein